jgi:C4-dicarboxylate-specific signal transduction histidine kinase/CheY-like chemotaxis protein
VVFIAVMMVVSARQQQRLSEATAVALAEQQIADDIVRGVMRQLVVVSVPPSQRAPAMQQEYESASAIVYERLRRYLFRVLTPSERLMLEQVKQEHLEMEVAAANALALAGQDEDETRRATEVAVGHAFALVTALEDFVRLRERELADVLQDQARALQTLAIGGIVAVLLLVAVQIVLEVRFVRRHVAVPLASLRDATVRIGAGDLSARVPSGYDAEFAGVAQSFNQMSVTLAAAREELLGRNAELSDALEQVRAAQQELVEAETLGAIGRMTAGLAHELNNPLASVLGYSELLSSRLDELPGNDGAALRTEFVDPIVREARRSRLLVRSLLQFARRADSELGPVALREALRVVTELRGFAFEQAGLRFVTEDIPDVAVIAERQHVQGVFLNIVNNALQALMVQGRGTLVVHGRLEGEMVELCFDDDGPGLADPARVFEAFYTTKGVGEGTGLGLALAERFMQSFGGSISASNRPEGGARFTLRFVRSHESPEAARPLYTPEHGTPLPLRRVEATDVAAAPTRDAVLVVEDEVHLQRLHEKLLARLDVEVVVCGSVAEARRIVTERSFAVIISDVKMPGESGIAFYEWICRTRPELASRFLFVTGDVGAPDLRRLVEDMPDAFLHKPFEGREYLARVGRLLG